MWVLERSWVGYSCSQSLHGNHPQVGSFWYFKNPLSAGILQPAGGSLCRSPGSLTATWTLEGAKILGSQIKAKRSIWLGRKEEMFCVVAGKLLSVRGSGLPVPRVWVSLWEGCWEWWQVHYHPVWWRFFLCSINLKGKLYQIKTISRKCPEMHWGMALTMSAEGTPFYI